MSNDFPKMTKMNPCRKTSKFPKWFFATRFNSCEAIIIWGRNPGAGPEPEVPDLTDATMTVAKKYLMICRKAWPLPFYVRYQVSIFHNTFTLETNLCLDKFEMQYWTSTYWCSTCTLVPQIRPLPSNYFLQFPWWQPKVHTLNISLESNFGFLKNP